MRPSWDAYFYGIAQAVAARADCQKRRHGAVIVDAHHRIIATGYNGTPPGDERSCLAGGCPRMSSVRPSDDYTDCIDLHAEQNAIANATRDMRGGHIYVWPGPPCSMCSKLCAAAGLTIVST